MWSKIICNSKLITSKFKMELAEQLGFKPEHHSVVSSIFLVLSVEIMEQVTGDKLYPLT